MFKIHLFQDRGLVGGGGVGGGGSPTNPDSTCQGEEMSKIKLEARLQVVIKSFYRGVDQW